MTNAVACREATADELGHWDDLTVRPPGGHVLQSRAWAEHRATRGWQPRYLVGDDGSAVLALLRPWPIVGGASAYRPRAHRRPRRCGCTPRRRHPLARGSGRRRGRLGRGGDRRWVRRETQVDRVPCD